MCKHQNVIDLIESFGMDGATWLAFPFYMALSVGLVHHRPTIRDHAMEITYGIAQGLYFLHSINVADLDVKPHNIVIDANFNARLIDFDCAVHVDGEGRTMTGFCGTKPWAAPEVGRKNEEYDPFLADRYSCGVVFNGLWLCVRPSAPELRAFSVALTSENPTDRPPLQAWIRSNIHPRSQS